MPSHGYGMSAACVAGLQALCPPGLVGWFFSGGVRLAYLVLMRLGLEGGGTWVSGLSKRRQQAFVVDWKVGNLGARSPRLCVLGSSGECSG